MSFLKRIYPFLLLYLLLSVLVFPQHRSLRFENITIDEGLSNNSINCIRQTKDGFIWIATKDGLNRYDGQNFKIFKTDPLIKNSLPENYVMSLLEGSDGTFWVGTWGGGLCKFDPLHETFIQYDLEYSDDDYIQALYEDRDNNIWYGTTKGGLNKLNPRTKKIITYRNDLKNKNYFPDNNITALIVDQRKNIWVGTISQGLIKFNPYTESYKQFTHNSLDQRTLSDNYVWDIYNDSDSCLFISTNNGLDILDLSNDKISNSINPLIDKREEFKTAFRQVIKDNSGNIWAGTYNYFGLYLFLKNKNHSDFVHLERKDDDANSLISSRIRWLYEDRSKNIWIGTEEGISKLPFTKDFIQYKFIAGQKNTLGGNVVSSIIVGKDSNLWIGYGGAGFDKINILKNTITHFKNDPNNSNSISVNDVVCMYLDTDEMLWIGTSYGGLNRYDVRNNTFKIYRNSESEDNSIKSDWVQQVLETRSGLLLIGTNDGLQTLNKESGKFYDFNPVNKNYNVSFPKIFSVNALFEDSKGDIWVGTWLDGLFRYQTENQTLYHYLPVPGNINSISASKVSCINQDTKGNIWIGTHSGGLNKFDNSSNKFTRITTKDGLPNDVVFGVLEDESGFLWISTMKGLAKYDPIKKTFRVYEQVDGIIHNQFNWHASYKDKNGKLYFGGINGFIVFDPVSILIDSLKSQIAFTSFKVFDKEATLPQSLPATREIILDYNQNFFSIEFAALDMAPANKHKYSYKLDGIDPDWINSETRTTAYYTDIDPGIYKFFVKASNPDNIWSEPISLSIIIKPAWWMTWWFKILIGLIILFLAFLIYRFRINQLLKIERIRYEIASDLHDEIGSNLSSISVDGQLLQKSESLTEREKELTSDISKTASQTLEAMRDIIWFINPKNDEGEDIIYKMKETASRLLVGLDWVFNSSSAVRFDGLSLEQRRNIFLIYKEALTNVIRHSQTKKCYVSVDSQSDKLIITVKDEGIGFDVNTVKKHTGILSMMKRAEKINGRLTFKSEPGSGSQVQLVVSSKSGLKQKIQMP